MVPKVALVLLIALILSRRMLGRPEGARPAAPRGGAFFRGGAGSPPRPCKRGRGDRPRQGSPRAPRAPRRKTPPR